MAGGIDFVLGEGKRALSSLWEGDSGVIIIIFLVSPKSWVQSPVSIAQTRVQCLHLGLPVPALS